MSLLNTFLSISALAGLAAALLNDFAPQFKATAVFLLAVSIVNLVFAVVHAAAKWDK